MNPAYHPQTDGQTKRMHQTLEQVLRSLIAGKETNWANVLPVAEFYMNSAPSSSTGSSPHEILFGSAPINPYTSVLSSQVTTDAPGVHDYAASRAQLWEQVQ